jgi:hypothetical protein
MRVSVPIPFFFLLATTFAASACSTPSGPTPPTMPNVVEPAIPVSPAPPPTPPAIVAAETARYRVTFEARWSPVTHPIDNPGSAHFSPLVGGTHAAGAVFWREGGLASRGIEDMAERGRTSPFDQEMAAAIPNGTAERIFTGGGIDKSPGTVSLEFDISQRFSLVTLVSMIAPSPDWFVGVSGLPLFENGQWIDQRRVELVPWDAGTDSGSTFFSPDQVTSPHAPISRILTAPLSPGGQVTALGAFIFTRLN